MRWISTLTGSVLRNASFASHEYLLYLVDFSGQTARKNILLAKCTQIVPNTANNISKL